MEKTITYTHLARGMGAVLGAFIRNSWLLQHTHPTIIGIKCGNKNIFDTFSDSTEIVTDLVLKIALASYTIDMPKVIAKGERIGNTPVPIYKIGILKSKDVLTTDDLAPYIIVKDHEELLKSMYQSAANDFIMELYIRDTGSVTSEDVNKSYLFEAGVTATQVVPIASSNRTSSIVTYSIDSTDISDTLALTFKGTSEDFEDFKRVVTHTDVELLNKVLV
ncbi:MAG: hypothetical protein RSC68_00565 [Acinetobacter sp.]